MNETIGTKGGKNDRRRMKIIAKKKKLKKEKERQERKLKLKEEKLRKIQILNLIKIIPIFTIGSIYESFSGKKHESKQMLLKEINKKFENNITLNSNDVKILKQYNIIEKIDMKYVEDIKKSEKVKEINLTVEQKNQKELKADKLKKEKKEINNKILKEKEKKIISNTNKDLLKLPIFTTIATVKIISSYENKLEDAKIELRNLIFEYNTLTEDLKKCYDDEAITNTIYNLNKLIGKINDLKSMYKIDDKEFLVNDDEYLNYKVDGYLNDFKNRTEILEFNNSDLFIEISEMIDNYNLNKENLINKIDSKKKIYSLDKNKKKTIDKKKKDSESIAQKLENMKKEQEEAMKKLEENIKNTAKLREKVEVKVKFMNNQSKKILQMVYGQLLFPGINSIQATILTTGMYVAFMREAMDPKVSVEKKLVFNQEGFDELKDSLASDFNGLQLQIYNSIGELNELIKEFSIEFKDYFNDIPECNEIYEYMLNLKTELQSKDYEIEKIKQEELKKIIKKEDEAKVYKKNN